MSNLAGQVYKMNSGSTSYSTNFISESELSKKRAEMESRRRLREEESKNQYREKRALKVKKERKKNLKNIYKSINKLSKLSIVELRALLLASGINPHQSDYENVLALVRLSMENKDFNLLCNNVRNNELKNNYKEIKLNLAKFTTEELCNFLNINPELNFSKKGQLINDLVIKIESDLSDDFEKTYLIKPDMVKNLTKRIYMENLV